MMEKKKTKKTNKDMFNKQPKVAFGNLNLDLGFEFHVKSFGLLIIQWLGTWDHVRKLKYYLKLYLRSFLP